MKFKLLLSLVVFSSVSYAGGETCGPGANGTGTTKSVVKAKYQLAAGGVRSGRSPNGGGGVGNFGWGSSSHESNKNSNLGGGSKPNGGADGNIAGCVGIGSTQTLAGGAVKGGEAKGGGVAGNSIVKA